jgi:hypothetical protein
MLLPTLAIIAAMAVAAAILWEKRGGPCEAPPPLLFEAEIRQCLARWATEHGHLPCTFERLSPSGFRVELGEPKIGSLSMQWSIERSPPTLDFLLWNLRRDLDAVLRDHEAGLRAPPTAKGEQIVERVCPDCRGDGIRYPTNDQTVWEHCSTCADTPGLVRSSAAGVTPGL